MEQNPSSQGDLTQVIDALFSGATTEFTTSTGVKILFPRAKLKQLAAATQFVQDVVNRAPKDKMAEFLDLIVGEQKKLVDEGKSVHDMNINTSVLLEKAIGNYSLLLQAFGACADILPKFVAIFTTITAEEFDEVELEEQLVIAAGVFAVNYGFFTQSLPPILRSIFGAMNAKNSAQGSKQAKQEKLAKPVTVTV